MINFESMDNTVLTNFYGGEGEMVANMVTDDKNRILKGKLAPGCSIGLHRHETSSEIIFILSGTATVILDGVEETLPVGTCHYCRKGQQHTMINNGNEDLVFFAVVPQQ